MMENKELMELINRIDRIAHDHCWARKDEIRKLAEKDQLEALTRLINEIHHALLDATADATAGGGQ